MKKSYKLVVFMINVSKKFKYKFIDFLEERCKRHHLSTKSLGILIRSYHYSTPLILLILMCLGGHWIAIGTICCYFVAAILFFTFRGCFISMLENRICQDEFNMVDPLLEVLQVEKTDKERMEISYYILAYYTTVLFGIYIVRFCLY